MELNRKNIFRLTNYKLSALIVFLIVMLFCGCKVKYSFSGAHISPLAHTFSVQYFQNRAPIVQTGLSQTLTYALIDKCKAQTNLKYITSIGDMSFEGEISDYNTKPQAVAADAQAALNRFTISVRVKFTNAIDPTLSFEQTFSRFKDYSSNLNLSDVEKEYSDEIVDLLVEDIFNQAFINW
jgi:hypothetical protein